MTARSHGEPIRVLLVDDHEHVLWGLSKLIDGEWPRMMVIGISRDMAQAKALIEDRRPDVVVLDVYVDGRNALDCMPELLSGACSDVIVHTSAGDEGVRLRAMEAGARCVVDKEAPAETLLREIVRVHGERLGRNEPP
ncbi:MAG TPA: response regulator [Burkholderiales bacterium]|nr:response regulator [Burkholderiales bacterium]